MGCGGSKKVSDEVKRHGFPNMVFQQTYGRLGQNGETLPCDKEIAVVMSAIGSVDIPGVTVEDVVQTICHFDGKEHDGIFMKKWDHNHKSENPHKLGLFSSNGDLLNVSAQVKRKTPMGELIMNIDMEVFNVQTVSAAEFGMSPWSCIEKDDNGEHVVKICYGFDMKAKAENKNVEFDAQMWRIIEKSDTGVKITDCMMCTRRKGFVMWLKGPKLMQSQIDGRMQAFKNAVEDYKSGNCELATYTDESKQIVTNWLKDSNNNWFADPSKFLRKQE